MRSGEGGPGGDTMGTYRSGISPVDHDIHRCPIILGYIQDLSHLHTDRVAEIVDTTKIAVIPGSDHEVAARENYHHHHHHHHNHHHHDHPHHHHCHHDHLYQPTRRSVIVTNSNHPANRYHSNINADSAEFYHNFGAPSHSPSLPTESEQNAPYDYSIRKEEKEPKDEQPLAPPSPKRFKSYAAASTSPAPAHTASPVTVHHPHLPSPPPAHQGMIDSAASAAPGSPKSNPPHEGLPADHPFHHPLIQKLINQRLHVPGENIHDDRDNKNNVSNDVNLDNTTFNTKDDTSNVFDNNCHRHHHPHHHRNQQQHHGQYYSYNQETTREDEVKESSSSSSSNSPSHSLSTSPSHHPESADSPKPLSPYNHNHNHNHHHHLHHHQLYQNNPRNQPPPHPTPSSSSYSTTLTPSHLPPLQSFPHPHSFPPSPSPTIPSSSPTLPNTESKSFFVLPPPSSPDSIPPSSSPASSPELNLTIVPSPNPNTQILPHPPTSTSPNSYTYEAFLISDGRSRKRSLDESFASEENNNNNNNSKSQNGRVRYTCNECGKDYATSSNLSRHKQTHRALDSKSAKKCPHCDKVYVSMPALSMHILTHDLKHACEVCGKTFSRPWLLQGHMRSHTGEKPFGCAHCGKAFADRSNLRAHMQTHSAFKHFACTKCKKTFALKSYLNKHLESSCVKVE